VGDREILEIYLNSASKNTSEIDIFPHGTKSLLTIVIGVNLAVVPFSSLKGCPVSHSADSTFVCISESRLCLNDPFLISMSCQDEGYVCVTIQVQPIQCTPSVELIYNCLRLCSLLTSICSRLSEILHVQCVGDPCLV
jgi:hypothetical protein